MDCGICNAAIWIAARPFWFCGGPILQSCLNERGSPTYLGLSYLPVRSANTEFLQPTSAPADHLKVNLFVLLSVTNKCWEV